MLTRRHLLANAAALPAGFSLATRAAAQSSDPVELGVMEAAMHLRQRQLSPLELTQAYLQRIERLQPSVNAYITVTADAALAQAQALTDELMQGRWRGPLHGIPIALKDNIDTAGIATTAANAMLANRIPTEDAPVWQQLKAAGAILLGKLNMHEFAYGGTSSISHAGAVHNPWNLDHIPGGSSGGSAAAVAAGMCAAALGTDTLASIRQPASYCGVVGLKPTHGLCSIRGIIPVSASLDHVGPLARSAADCAVVLQAMVGYDALDPVSKTSPAVSYTDSLMRQVSGLRIGIPRSLYFERLHPDIAKAMDAALAVFASLTASMRDVSLPTPPDFVVLLAESYAWHQRYLQDQSNHRFYHSSTLERILAAGQTPSADYVRVRDELTLIRRRIGDVFSEVDVLVTPTVPTLPERIDRAELAEANGAESSVRNTAPFNLYGIPTISLPCGISESGLPIGLQLSSATLDESTLFALAQAWQLATDWQELRPTLLVA